MSFCVLTIRDGRDEVHERSLASLKAQVPEPAHHVIIDDDAHELGFAGAIAEGWRQVLATGAEFAFHHEADFVFLGPVAIDHMAGLLKRHPYLTQVALKRQPVNDEERGAGGIVECHPDDFDQRHDGGYVWTEHRRFGFTTNPSVYPVALCAQGWPQTPESEGQFGIRLLRDPSARSCFWGGKFDPPRVEHVGARVGTGY